MKEINKLIDSFQEKKQKKISAELSNNNECSNASVHSTASKSKDDSEPSNKISEETFDLKKTVPFLELA